MGPGLIVEWAKAIAVCGGVIGGLFAVFSVSWVWLRHHVFQVWAGGILCAFGTTLVIGPLYSRVSFVSDGKRVEFKLGELERELSQTRTALEQTNKKYTELATDWQRITVSPSQVTKLQKDLDALSTKVTQVNAASETALQRWRIIMSVPPGLEGKAPPNPNDNSDNGDRPRTAPFMLEQNAPQIQK